MVPFDQFLEAWNQPAMRHAMVGHFPIVLFVIGLPFVLVRTGHGEETLRRLARHEHARLLVAGDLWEAYQAIRVHFHPRRRLEAA